ncbi:hypothetical protein [Brachyspira hyodysenteriae]|nr:hypothetical protein [Brachyspira hyodysenteriae]MCZ9896264.1 hypothetical protein [Brachyspira hyodysenteriae]
MHNKITPMVNQIETLTFFPREENNKLMKEVYAQKNRIFRIIC